MINIILCGGSGTRLWPVSRTESPKQFYKFFDDISLFQQTILRNAPLCTQRMVVTNMAQSLLCRAQEEETARWIDRKNVFASYLIEPVGRNTAPAIALAALAVSPDEILLVCPSDQAISNNHAYESAIKRAQTLAERGHIVAFGIQPTKPETGYGYIEADGEEVLSFKEKPDHRTAATYVEDGRHYWNSGIFCFKASIYLSELAKYAPEIYEASVAAFNKAGRTGSTTIIDHNDMMAIPEKSVDYAIMEQSDLVKVVPCACGWSDLGSFDALYDYLDKDDFGNAIDTQAIHIDSTNNYTLSASGRPVVTVGVEDLVIVDKPDALLIAKRGQTQNVRKAFEALKQTPEYASLCHRNHKTATLWGSITVIENNASHSISRLSVHAGKSADMSRQDGESQWIVISGRGHIEITGGDKVALMANSAVRTHAGQKIRFVNHADDMDLILIETCIKKSADAMNRGGSLSPRQRQHG